MLRCSLINKFEANVFGNILVHLLQYYMTYLNIFYHCLMRYFYQNICYVKLMNCGCRLFRLTQGTSRGGNLHYTPWLCTKPKATYKLFLTYCKIIYNLFTNSTYLQSIDKVFTRYLPTYYLQSIVCRNLVWILKFRPLWIWFSRIFKVVTIFLARSCL